MGSEIMKINWLIRKNSEIAFTDWLLNLTGALNPSIRFTIFKKGCIL